MSGPAIAAVGLVLSAKTTYDGLKEGNLVKAALGGVGAYLGATNLAANAGASATAAATEELGTEAAKSAASGMVEPAALAGTDIAAGGKTAMDAGIAAQAAPPVAEPVGFLAKAGQWMEKNPTLAFGTMQAGGNLLSGYAQGEMAQAQIDEARRIEDQRRKDEEQARKRREYWAPTGFLSKYQYTPLTGGANGTA